MVRNLGSEMQLVSEMRNSVAREFMFGVYFLGEGYRKMVG